MTKDIIVFDLDGTLALIDHRRHLVRGRRKQWDAFFRACVDDQPNLPVVETYRALLASGRDFYHLILSGRSDAVRPQTEAWLAQHVGFYHELRMRRDGDYTPDEVLKRRWAEPIRDRIFCVFDDRDKVVRMWRELGITCFQVAPGDF